MRSKRLPLVISSSLLALAMVSCTTGAPQPPNTVRVTAGAGLPPRPWYPLPRGAVEFKACHITDVPSLRGRISDLGRQAKRALSAVILVRNGDTFTEVHREVTPDGVYDLDLRPYVGRTAYLVTYEIPPDLGPAPFIPGEEKPCICGTPPVPPLPCH